MLGQFVVGSCGDQIRNLKKDIREELKDGIVYEYLVEWEVLDKLNKVLDTVVNSKDEYDEWHDMINDVANCVVEACDDNDDLADEIEDFKFYLCSMVSLCEDMVDVMYELDPMEDNIDQMIGVLLGNKVF